MAFVPGYEHDVFVSYSHVDNQPPGGYAKGWVTEFLDELNRRVCRYLGRVNATSIWMDVRMNLNDSLRDQIQTKLDRSATLLVLHSMGYLNSEWCAWERKAFQQSMQGGHTLPGSIFFVELSPMAPEMRAPEFQDMIGYQFWKYDADGQTPMYLGEPLPQGADGLYRSRIAKLAHDLAKELMERKAKVESSSTMIPPLYTRSTTMPPPSTQIPSGTVSQPSEEPHYETSQAVEAKPQTPSVSEVKKKKVMLAYKRDVEPDKEILQLLERELAQAGYEVFIDRNLRIGVVWAQEIAKQIRESYAIIPLISSQSIQSEMLGFEIQEASEAAEKQGGQPYILPVRIDYQEALPKHFPGGLDRINYFLWKSEEDSPKLIENIIDALDNPSNQSGNNVKSVKFEPAGGAVALDSKFYVERHTDKEFTEAIQRRDSIVLVKGARQIGKTSLLARGLDLARKEDSAVIHTDMQQLSASDLESSETLFKAFSEILIDDLDLDVDVSEFWNPGRGPTMNFKRFMRRHVLKTIGKPLVWGLDEVDRLFSCNFASEVFGLFRSWHNERALNPSGPWAQLTLAMAYATEAHLFITDVHQSPFNVGTRMSLDDFTLEQVRDLNQRYESPIRSDEDVKAFHRLVGGQPYLTQRGFNEIVNRSLTFSQFESTADSDEGIYGDHLRRMLVMMSKNKPLMEGVRDFTGGKPLVEMEHFWRLRSAGILVGDSPESASFRCCIYHSYLSRHL
jgi:nucleotide-binding universal stress UspA family protein